MTRRTLAASLLAVAGGMSSWCSIAAHAAGVPSASVPLPSHRLPDLAELAYDRTIERYLSRGDDHRYRLSLNAGVCVRVIVQQRGVDVLVETRDPAGNLIAEFDDEIRPRGAEQIDLVAEVSGTYTIRVRTSPVTFASGGY